MRPIFKIIPALALLTLSACATPLERCVSQAQKQTARSVREIARYQGNIDRGYALHRQSVPYTYYRRCQTETGTVFACPQTRFHWITTPVSIDTEAEERKLATARERLVNQRRQATAVAANCQAQFPEN